MKKVVMLFLLVIFLISGAACESIDTTVNQTISLNPIELQKQIDELNKQVGDLKSQIEDLKQDKKKLEKENEDLKEELEEYKPKIIKSTLDLSAWSADDILNKFQQTDFVFARAGWYSYEYDGKNYYDRYGQQFYGEDEFYEIKYMNHNRELNISHLRMFKLGLKKSVDEEYQDYMNKIGVKSSADSGLQCVTKTDCRDVKVTECSKAGKKFFAWFASDWLFTARDDGYALEVFKKFYC